MKIQLAFVTLFALSLAHASCWSKSEGAASTEAPKPVISVETVLAVLEDVSQSVAVTGTLAPWEEATVALEADGRLVRVAVDLGDRVRRGQLLAQVAPQEYEFRKAQADADLAAAQAAFRRTEELAQKGAATDQLLDEARRRLEFARTAAELASKKLGDASLLAPIDGLVARRMINVGEFARTGAAAFQIVRTVPLKLKADIPERYVQDVAIGAEVEVRSEALHEVVLRGTVVRVSPIVAVDSRSFPIEAQIENPGGNVKPGTFARAVIAASRPRRSLVVPEAAATSFAGTPRVFVLEDGLARERVVELEGRAKGRLLIGKGLAEGARVIVSGVDKLIDGQPVVTRSDAAAPR